MKIAVTGANGKMGSRLVALGAIPLHFDLMDTESIGRELQFFQPDVLIHTASMTSVEDCQKDYNQAILVNTRGTNHVCEWMGKLFGDGRVILLSSDHVFNGRRGHYQETDKPDPVNYYGFSKMGAESVAGIYHNKVIRLSRGVSFDFGSEVHDLVYNLRGGFMTDVPTFIYRSYCHLDLLAESVWWCAQALEKLPPILHIAGEKSISQYDFLKTVAKELGYDTRLIIPRRSEKDGFAPRPLRAGLNVSLAKKIGVPIFPLEQTLKILKDEHGVPQVI